MPVMSSPIPSPRHFRPAYRTPAGPPPSWLARHWPEGWFYPRVFRIVWQSSRRARRGLFDDREWAWRGGQILELLERMGNVLEVEGGSHLDGLDGPCVFVANHMSTLETFALSALVWPHSPITFVVKRSLITYPIFSDILNSRHPVVVGRSKPREDLATVLREGGARLAGGRSVVVFPQTTRNLVFQPGQFNSIGVKLARRAGVPLLPVALRTDAWANGRWLKDFGPVQTGRVIHFAFGAPLIVTGNGREEHRAVVEFISAKLHSWGSPVGDVTGAEAEEAGE